MDFPLPKAWKIEFMALPLFHIEGKVLVSVGSDKDRTQNAHVENQLCDQLLGSGLCVDT